MYLTKIYFLHNRIYCHFASKITWWEGNYLNSLQQLIYLIALLLANYYLILLLRSLLISLFLSIFFPSLPILNFYFIYFILFRFGNFEWYNPKKITLPVPHDCPEDATLIPLITFPITHLKIMAIGTEKPHDSSHYIHPLNSLPPSITHLTFLAEFWKSDSSQTLVCFSQNQVSFLPKLTHLALSYTFNQPINFLPQSLTHLTIGNRFNLPVDSLPSSLTHIKFGMRFNQPVDFLPHSLTHLTFGYEFNQQVNHLPSMLTHLSFARKFNENVDYHHHSFTLSFVDMLCSTNQ